MAGGYLSARPLREPCPRGLFASLTLRGWGFLIPLASLLIPHSSPLIPHSSFLIPLASLPPVIPGVSAEPKLRHSARSRGIHASHHARIDAATTRSMTACVGQRCPPTSPTPFPRHSAPLPPVIPGLIRNLPSSGCPYLAGVDVSSLLTPHGHGHGTPCPYGGVLLTPLASLRPVIPGVSAEPKLRHSAPLVAESMPPITHA